MGDRESSSLPSERVQALVDEVQSSMNEAGLHACQFALAIDGEVVVQETLGPAPPDARFLIFSATKPLVASVVWQLIGEGFLDPAQRVATWWPDFARNGKDAITLEHVMVHTAGFPNAPLTDAATFDRDRRVAEIEDWDLDWEPGSHYEYHGLSAHWVLAELIERVTGTGYRSALRERVLDPLGLDRIELGVATDRQHDVRPITHVGSSPTVPEIEDLLGISLDALPTAPAAPAGGVDVIEFVTRPDVMAAGVPGGGAVSDAASLALFYQHLLHDPKGLWDPGVLLDATTNVRNRLPDMIGRAAFRTLGLESAGDDDMATKRIGAGATSSGTFGHAGAGGQVAWADPDSGLSFVFLTDTFDANFVRMYRRDAALTRLAARCDPHDNLVPTR